MRTLAPLLVLLTLALPACLDERLGPDQFVAQTAEELDGGGSDTSGSTDTASSDDVEPPCKPSAGACDDGNPCTTDSCVNELCSHVAVISLLPCSHGGKSGVCKAGRCQ